MVLDISIKAAGLTATIRRMTSRARYFKEGIEKDLRRVGTHLGIPVLAKAISDSGIQRRTSGKGSLFESIEIKESSSERVVFGFTEDKAEIAFMLDQGGVVKAPGRREEGVFALEKGPGEGVVFRRAIYEDRIIRPRNFMDAAVEELNRTLPNTLRASVIREMRR